MFSISIIQSTCAVANEHASGVFISSFVCVSDFIVFHRRMSSKLCFCCCCCCVHDYTLNKRDLYTHENLK